MALFENYERRVDGINAALKKHGIASLEEARKMCQDAGFDPYEIVKGIQPICFENACWAYILGAAIALKENAIFMMTSAKNKNGIDELFSSIANKIFKCTGDDNSEEVVDRIKQIRAKSIKISNKNIKESNDLKKKGCC